jgi:hypothetical protein
MEQPITPAPITSTSHLLFTVNQLLLIDGIEGIDGEGSNKNRFHGGSNQLPATEATSSYFHINMISPFYVFPKC